MVYEKKTYEHILMLLYCLKHTEINTYHLGALYDA